MFLNMWNWNTSQCLFLMAATLYSMQIKSQGYQCYLLQVWCRPVRSWHLLQHWWRLFCQWGTLLWLLLYLVLSKQIRKTRHTSKTYKKNLYRFFSLAISAGRKKSQWDIYCQSKLLSRVKCRLEKLYIPHLKTKFL